MMSRMSHEQAVQFGYASRHSRGGGGALLREADLGVGLGGGGGNGFGGGGGSGKSSTYPPQDLLEDLCSRFILNAPEEDLQSFERILFLVEQAHWFYEDFTREEKPSLRHLTLREFTALVFRYCTSLQRYVPHVDTIYNDFTLYKIRVPVAGAILLNQTCEKCLLVKGYKPGASWGFPKGKKSKDEEDSQCAIREVKEETGFDLSALLRPEDFLEVSFGQQRTRLFIVKGVDEKTAFAPETKKEISDVAWHRVDDLPCANNISAPAARGLNGHKYFMVWPFMSGLKSWIASHSGPAANHSAPEGNQTAPAGNQTAPAGNQMIRSGKQMIQTGNQMPQILNRVPFIANCVPQRFAAFQKGNMPGMVPHSWKKVRDSVPKAPISPARKVDNFKEGVVDLAASKQNNVKAAPVAPRALVTGPGVSFRNFYFDREKILRQMDSEFSCL